MGKPCPACGERFVGFGELCDVCRRRPPVAAPAVTLVTPKAPEPVTAVTRKASIVTPVTHEEDLEAERDRLLARLAEINALLGPMTAAERQRKARARAKLALGPMRRTRPPPH